jgi:hypothetical protein
MQRRDALKVLGAAICTPSCSSILAGEAGKPSPPRWKTAIGLNGFQSAAAKYGKTFPIREVLDHATRTGFDGVELVPNWPPLRPCRRPRLVHDKVAHG